MAQPEDLTRPLDPRRAGQQPPVAGRHEEQAQGRYGDLGAHSRAEDQTRPLDPRRADLGGAHVEVPSAPQ
ncbi:hypothetical protein, partial [Actinoplanes sp. NPDC051851]|uniref:hypothetical protein n=1 Tax=Actinoplanes sp. NPDC051851 TaxID=3154753 RepID=UPI00342CFD7C